MNKITFEDIFDDVCAVLIPIFLFHIFLFVMIVCSINEINWYFIVVHIILLEIVTYFIIKIWFSGKSFSNKKGFTFWAMFLIKLLASFIVMILTALLITIYSLIINYTINMLGAGLILILFSVLIWLNTKLFKGERD